MPEILFLGADCISDRYWTPGGYKVKFRKRSDGTRRAPVMFRTFDEFNNVVRRGFVEGKVNNKKKK